METKKDGLNWIDYERIANGEFQDIIIAKNTLAKLIKREKKIIKLPNYQIDFLMEKYPKGNFSEAMREALDDLIKLLTNGSCEVEKKEK